MSTLLFARALMGISLGFHIIYATIGVGLPLMLLMVEALSLRTGDPLYRRLARRWIRTAAVLFAIGAVSGTILSFELGFLWPRFMELGGALIGLPFSMEGFAFFTEAIFLGLYLYGERRLSPRALFLCTIPMTVAAAASAVFVISANAWMQTPAGFRLEDGVLTDLRPFRAMANPTWLHEALHGTLAAYAATGIGVAGLYAAALLRGHDTDYNRRALSLSMLVAAVFVPLMLLSGDFSARSVAHIDRPKFAAMEGIFETTRGAPLHLGGWPDPATQEVKYGLAIPKLLSFLGYRDFNAPVTGLNDFPPGTTPDPRKVHVFFQVMVGSFFVMLAAVAAYWWQRWRRPRLPAGRRTLRLIWLASPFGLIALEAGWLVTEFGRLPWIATDLMRVSEGVTPRQGIAWVFLAFLAVYVALTIGLLRLLVRPNPPATENPAAGRGHVHP